MRHSLKIYFRNFFPGEKEKVCLINEKILTMVDWKSWEGKELFGARIVGVVNVFHYKKMYNPIGGITIINSNDVSHISLRMLPNQNISQAIDQIKNEFKQVLPEYGFDFYFYDDWLNRQYKQEENRAASIRFLAILTIIISCLGLFGLAEFSMKKKIKEIGIRKVNGAKIREILAMLNTEFLQWVIIAFIIACPIAWYAMTKWLEDFAYKTAISWWVFALAGTIALVIALLTVSWQSWRAARRNPVEALRYE